MTKLTKDRVKLIRVLMKTAENDKLSAGDHQQLSCIIHFIRQDAVSHYLSLSQDDSGKVSYSDRVGTKYDTARRIKTTFARYVRRRLQVTTEDLSDNGLALIGSQLFAQATDSEPFIDIVRGAAIVELYRSEWAVKTCMSGDCSSYTQIYADNPDKVGMVVYNNGVKARALLWTTDGGTKVLDRIYPDDTGSHIAALRKWATDKGYITRWTNSLPNEDSVSLSDSSIHKVTLLNKNDRFPYFDTFCFGDICGGEVELCNDSEDCESIFQSTGGDYESVNRLECYHCSCRIDENDCSCDENGYSYCNDCYCEVYAYCENCNSDFDREDAIECKDNNWIYCPDCAGNNLGHCESCDSWVKEYTTADDTSNVFCEDCLDELNHCEDCGECYENTKGENKEDGWHCEDCIADSDQAELFDEQKTAATA